MKFGKKAFSAVLAILLCLSSAACSSGGSTSSATSSAASSSTASSTSASASSSSSSATASGGKIELAYGLSTNDLSVFKDLMAKASKEIGATIDVVETGADHESIMKTRMASGDLPDMWTTHGWSVMRYSEYLTNLNDQDWVQYIDPGLKSVITNDKGELFILPITMAVCGGLYNADVLKQAGVDVTSIHTWANFSDACKTILDKTGVKPLYMAINTKDSVSSYMLECIWPSLLTCDGLATNYRDKLKDGSFDWTSDIGTKGFSMVSQWYKAGYFNADLVSATKVDAAQSMANGKTAFMLYSTDLIPSILSYNSKVNIGIMPVPAAEEGGKPSFGTGEGNYSCFGIWKDTKYPQQCKALLEYLSKPEQSTIIVKIDGSIPCLSNIKVDPSASYAYTYNAMTKAQKDFSGIYYDNFFDRKYLPSGMWSVLKDSMATLLADNNPDASISKAAETVATNYKDLSAKK